MNDRFKSRKFLFTCLWCLFIVIGMVTQLITGQELSYMGQLVTFSGTITAAYIGLQGYADARK